MITTHDEPPPGVFEGALGDPAAIAAVIVGLAVGVLAGRLHHRLLARAVDQAIAKKSTAGLLVGMPLRLGPPVLALFALALWRPAALVGGLVGLGAALVWARQRPPAPAADADADADASKGGG
ncbi:MAG: hypothetical protein H6710_00960 [Myxococcales bacterium]|nr:hypothetical protein [Myxococcales bacterium]MCB9703020.1 hypothetical protein [Myxococcales bacterium]